MNIVLRILKYRKTIDGVVAGWDTREFIVPEQEITDAASILFEETLAEVKRLGFDYQLVEQRSCVVEERGSWPRLVV